MIIYYLSLCRFHSHHIGDMHMSPMENGVIPYFLACVTVVCKHWGCKLTLADARNIDWHMSASQGECLIRMTTLVHELSCVILHVTFIISLHAAIWKWASVTTISDASLYIYLTAGCGSPIDKNKHALHYAMIQNMHLPHINMNIIQKYFGFIGILKKNSRHNYCSFAS